MPIRPELTTAALILCLGAGQLDAQDPLPTAAPEDRLPKAFLELRVPDRPTFIGQPVEVELVFGLDSSLDEAQLIQLFQRRLDLPVQVDAPWIDELECTSAWSRPARGQVAASASFVLNGELAWARRLGLRTREGTEFDTFAYATSFVPTCALPLELSEVSMRFAIATRFEPDLFGRRSPQDRVEGRAVSQPASVSIARLPEAGRPVEFIDAVGQFSCEAVLEPQSVQVGQPLTLLVRVRGSGNLEELTAPRLDWSGFHLLGVRDGFQPGERTFRYELVANASGDFEPRGWSLHYFDPTPPGSYRSTSTGRFRVRVTPAESIEPARLPAPPAVTLPARTPPPASPLWPIAVSAALLLALLLAPEESARSRG